MTSFSRSGLRLGLGGFQYILFFVILVSFALSSESQTSTLFIVSNIIHPRFTDAISPGAASGISTSCCSRRAGWPSFSRDCALSRSRHGSRRTSTATSASPSNWVILKKDTTYAYESNGLTDTRALINGRKPRPLVHDVHLAAAFL